MYSSNRYPKAAGAIHTIVVLAALGVGAVLTRAAVRQMSAIANPHRARFYVLSLFFEWLILIIVLAGVRRSGASLAIVLGNRWQSVRQLLRDVGIALLFWIVAMVALFLFSLLLGVVGLGRNMQFLLPQGVAELAAWIALSITAGICEEAIFRGYLQRQFIVLTRNVPAGIFLSAATFGAVHAYQGFRMAIVIGLYGAMFGILAHWRGSVRPGMMAHAWHDSLFGILANIPRR